jgi:quinol monooxygenase YgiN
MKKDRLKTIIITALTFVILSVACGQSQTLKNAPEEQQKNQVIHLAKLRIDSSHLEPYLAALKEEIETSVRVEPGVLTLYAVSDKDDPTDITVFEVYANAESYKTHLGTPHFKEYKNSTKEMVKSLEIIDLDPIILRAKSK